MLETKNNKEIIDAEAVEISPAKSITKDFIFNLDWNDIGPCVLRCDNGENTALTKTAATICRRRFKPADIVLISVLDEDEEGEAGIAFTSKGLYYWDEDDTFVFDVNYADIASVDYDEDSVKLILSKKDPAPDSPELEAELETLNSFLKIANMSKLARTLSGEIKHLPCVGSDTSLDDDEVCEYARNLYNFISDIVDELHG